eukprot:CAMPEP_0113904794 /NCGR_PEP_ID=MMETSP0780_2-20120614/23526_1 /TAXON_ID=652834 /ORGANISM="Palpitomonas bilix" /LENGTH=423 /DNA_ID=CAMNT_0000898595 /DNA_START=113 /DNA_END=1384 /DNA_ORIENTATION=- /assembly_acc=CAM_ASM_000599
MEGRWSDLGQLLLRDGPLAVAGGFEAGPQVLAGLGEFKVLVVGAGGLGCELLKNLAMSGFKQIDVIDMDTIEITNLNRQFLFRKSDVKKPKAEVAARFVMERVEGVSVTSHFCRIEEKDEDFYSQFNCIVLGLDSVEARRWMNAMVCSLVEKDEDGDVTGGLIPVVDGGTEGFKGHARVIFPCVTACFECTLDLFPPQIKFPLCTLAETPRTAAHCIEWAKLILWEKERADEAIDTDNPEHIQWLYEASKRRAAEYGIEGVTLSHTLGVVKNIIPAIASTNAIVAAACTNEVLKIATYAAPAMEDYLMYVGNAGVNTHTFQAERKDDCLVCSKRVVHLSLPRSATLQALVEELKENSSLRLKGPSLRTAEKTLYMTSPPSLEEMTRPNLDKALHELVSDGGELSVSDPVLATAAISVIVSFSS